MKRKVYPTILVFFVFSFEIFLSGTLRAGVITAAGTSQSAVQNAINQAQSGDTVMVPAGNASWTNKVSISGKSITVMGAGKNSTVITLSVSGEGIYIGPNASRVTGMGFILSSGWFFIASQGQNFRVDHCKFENQISGIRDAVYSYGDATSSIAHPTGVIDHNEMIDSRTLVSGDINIMANPIWSQPSTIGNPDQTGVVYIEDNTFTHTIFSNTIDADYGGRYVFRYNTINATSLGGYFEAHSVMEGGNNRATRSWEIYNNTVTRNDAFFTAMDLRGGTGVVFDNIVTGQYGTLILLDNVRSFDDLTSSPAGPCNGSSSWDGNITNGWPCRDQIGRGQDAAGTFPQPQSSEPAYFWNNKLNGTLTNPDIANCSNAVKPNGVCADVVVSRDYFVTQRPGYSPYCYPHPLVSGIPCNPATGVHETNSGDGITVYPNPSKGMFNVEWIMDNGNTPTISHYPLTIEVYNVFGQKIFDGYSKMVDLSSQPNGIYFIKAKTEQNSDVKKVVLSK